MLVTKNTTELNRNVAAEFDRNLAVVIGINDYGEGIGKLNTAVKDAEDVADLLEEDYGYEVIRFINEKAKGEQLRQFFDKDLVDKLKDSQKKRLIVYFAGHGINSNKNLQEPPKGFLIPQDAKKNDVGSYLPMSEVLKALEKLNCHHLLMILDCCYSGTIRFNREFIVETEEKIYKEHYHHFIEHQAWQFITSTAHDQVAADNFDISNDKRGTVANSENSPFAFALIEGLKNNKADENKDAVIESNELCQYVERKMRELSLKPQIPQIGSLRSEYDKGKFIFTRQNFNVDELHNAPELNEDNNPYRGLKAFTEKHAKFFFGREKLVKELSDRLSQSNLLTVVVGVSGSGKSSFVQAGLIPYLKKSQNSSVKWEILNPVRPGQSPFTALAKAILPIENPNLEKKIKDKYSVLDNILAAELKNKNSDCPELANAWQGATLEAKLLLFMDYSDKLKKLSEDLESLAVEIEKNIHNLEDKLKKDDNSLNEIIAKWKESSNVTNTKLLLVIDQFEELITMSEESHQETSNQNQQNKKPKLWHKFLNRIKQVKKEHSQNICILLTLRSDFESYFYSLESSENSDLFSSYEWNKARFPMKLMSSDELRQTIVEPALMQGVFFEKEPKGWVSEIVDEVSQIQGGLPLLSFTLSELYLKHYNKRVKVNPEAKDRALKYDDYDQLGGIRDSLKNRATEIYNELKSETEQAIMRRIMLRMVRFEGTEKAKRRVPLSELEYPDIEKDQKDKVINYLVYKRLVVQGKETGEKYIEPVHDCLIKEWQSLKDWITQEQEEIILRQRLTPDAQSWNELQNNSKNSVEKNNEKTNNLANFFGKIESFIIEKSQSIQRNKQRKAIEKRKQTEHNENNPNNSNGKPKNYLWNNDPRLDELNLVLDSDDNWLNEIENTFVRESLIQKGRNIYRSFFGFGGITLIIGLLSLGFFLGNRQAKINEIRVSQESAEANLESNSDLEAIVDILRAGKNLKDPLFWGLKPDENRLAQVRETLSKILYQTRERNRLQLDTGRVYQVAFYPQGGFLATVGNGDSVRLWDTNSNEQKQLFSTNQEEVYSVAFSSDGTRMASGADDGTVKLWKINQNNKTVDQSSSRDIIPQEKHQSIRDVEFSPKDDLLVTVIRDKKGKRTVKLWDRKVNSKNNNLLPLLAKNLINFTADSMEDDWTFEESQTILDNNSCSKLEDKENIYDVAFSPNGNLLAMVGNSNRVILWDYNTNECDLINNTSEKTQEKENVRRVVFVKDNQLAIGTEGNKVKLLTIKDGKFNRSKDPQLVIYPKEKQQGFIRSIAFDIDSEQLVTISTQDYIGRLWDSNKDYEEIPKKRIEPLEGNIERITARNITFTPDGKKLATVAGDGTVKLWNLEPNQNTTKATEFFTGKREVRSVAFTPDGKNPFLAIGESDGRISLWDISSGEQIDKTIPLGKSVENITFTYEKNQGNEKQLVLIATFDDGAVSKIYTDGKKIAESPVTEFPTNSENIRSLALHPNLKKWATIDKEGKVKLWDISNPTFSLEELPESFDLSFSHDGELLAVGGKDGTITIFDNLGNELDQFQAKKENINSIAFHPKNNEILAIAGDDGTVRFLDISSNTPDPETATTNKIVGVSFNNDGKLIAITEEEDAYKSVSLWQVTGKGKIEPKIDTSNSKLFTINSKIAEFSSNKNQLTTVETDEKGYDIIKLWDILDENIEPITIPTEQQKVNLIAFPSENLLASRGIENDDSNDGKITIKLWELKNNKFSKKELSNTKFGEFQSKQDIYSVAFSRDGKFIATTTKDNNNVQVWKTNGESVNEFTTQQELAYVAFSPDGKQLATGGKGGRLKLWDIKGNRKKRFTTQMETIYSILFSPYGNQLVITGKIENSKNNVVKLFDLSGKELKQFETPHESESIIRVKFSPYSKRLITFTDSGKVRLWQIGDVKELMESVCKFSKHYLQSSSDITEGDRNLCE